MEAKQRKRGHLVRISLDSDGGYFFVYENGMVYRALKEDMNLKKPRSRGSKGSAFWRKFICTLNSAVNEEKEENKAIA